MMLFPLGRKQMRPNRHGLLYQMGSAHSIHESDEAVAVDGEHNYT